MGTTHSTLPSHRPIARYGRYLSTDDAGFVVGDASSDLIQDSWKPAIEDALDHYIWLFDRDRLRSIYLRGSVARGQALDGISDLDFVLVVTDTIHQAQPVAALQQANARLTRKYPYVAKIESSILPLSILAISPHAGFTLGTQAVCVFGQPLTDLPRYRIGSDIAFNCRRVRKHMDTALRTLSANESSRSDTCAWITKRLLRSGFELVMERERVYTRDLYLCYESFNRHYGSREHEMYEVLELAVNPIGDGERLRTLLERWLAWLPLEVATIFPTLRPA